ncbi:MAG TPA: hypothetical protein VGD15_06745, partial [Kribbella sp.]
MSEARVTALGHAGLRVDAPGVRLPADRHPRAVPDEPRRRRPDQGCRAERAAHERRADLALAQTWRAMAEVGGEFDLMGVQMSGASWHPLRYEYDEAERERISTIKRIGKFKAVTRLLLSVQPRLVMPYAGPPCFL